VIRAVGDSALIVNDDAIKLVSARGVVAQWNASEIAGVASLEDPARLAILSRSTWCIDVVDVATGAVQRSFDVGARGLLGFTPDGTRLLVDTADGASQLAIVDENGVRRDIVVKHYGYEHLPFEAKFAGDSAFLRSTSHRFNGTVMRVDLAKAAVDWESSHELTRFFVDDAGTNLVGIERPTGVGRAEALLLCNLVSGGNGWFTRHVDGTELVGLWANKDLSSFVYLDDPGGLVAIRWAPPTREFTTRRLTARWQQLHGVDAGGERALFRTEHDMELVDFDERVACRAEVGEGARALFSADTAFVLDGGRVVALTANGVVAIEGPTNLARIVAHRRGVLAVDDEDRAHVAAFDEDAS
jgi:hypothetical protein